MDSCQFKFIFSSIANQVRPNCHRFFKDAGYAASFNFEIASVTDPAIGGGHNDDRKRRLRIG